MILAFSTDQFVLPLPEGHRFPMAKYRLLRERAEAMAGVVVREPPALSDTELLRVHAPRYVQALTQGLLSPAEQRALGFPWSPAMVERSRRSAGATVAAARAVLRGEAGLAANLAGGTHHAHRDRGEGFCCFNDAALAARLAQHEGLAQRVAILDLDVHQGDGTASLFAHDPSVCTVSLHGAHNFPFAKAASDLDLPLPDGTGDADYLSALETALAFLEARGPWQLLVLLLGADPLAEDRLGRLSLSLQGLAARDHRVLHWAKALGLPTVIAMAGGYARPIELTVEAHAQSLAIAAECFGR